MLKSVSQVKGVGLSRHSGYAISAPSQSYLFYATSYESQSFVFISLATPTHSAASSVCWLPTALPTSAPPLFLAAPEVSFLAVAELARP